MFKYFQAFCIPWFSPLRLSPLFSCQLAPSEFQFCFFSGVGLLPVAKLACRFGLLLLLLFWLAALASSSFVCLSLWCTHCQQCNHQESQNWFLQVHSQSLCCHLPDCALTHYQTFPFLLGSVLWLFFLPLHIWFPLQLSSPDLGLIPLACHFDWCHLHPCLPSWVFKLLLFPAFFVKFFLFKWIFLLYGFLWERDGELPGVTVTIKEHMCAILKKLQKVFKL